MTRSGSAASGRPPPDNTLLRQFVSRPRQIGTLRRSSAALGRMMARMVLWPEDRAAVIEAGPGDGAITESLIAARPEGARFLAVEVNPECARALSRRLPEVEVVVDDLANLDAICRRQEIPEVGVVVATLPWSLLPKGQQEALIRAILAALGPGGQLLFYIYVQALPFWKRSLFAQQVHARFAEVRRTPIIWTNFPPAVVFDCRGLRP